MMIPQAARQTSADPRSLLEKALLLVVIGVLGYLLIMLAITHGDLLARGWSGAPATLGLAALLYLGGHGFRILRLALLIGGWRVGFRDVIGFHLLTSAFSFAVPLVVGEGYRVFELGNIAGGYLRSLVMVWCLRAFDTVVILLMLLFAMLHTPTAGARFGAVAALAVAFVGVTAIVFFIVPDNLRRLSVFIIRRYDSASTVTMLRVIDALRRAHSEVPELLKGKVASLASLTALVWVCEIASFTIAMPAFGGSLNAVLDGLLTFLSAITRGETLFSVLDRGGTEDIGQDVLYYVGATQVPLLIAGIIASVHYVRFRFRS